MIADDSREWLCDFFHTGSRSALVFGMLAQIIGIIDLLSNMSDPSSIGIALAYSMLPLFYGIILSEIFFVPLHKNVSRTLPVDKRRHISLGALLLIMAFIYIILGTFFVSLLSFVPIESFKL
jgi:flagellar motor component MotA